jgi:hypothetical protein
MKVAWMLMVLLMACGGFTSITSELQQQADEDQAKKTAVLLSLRR